MAELPVTEPCLIPRPVSVDRGNGVFELRPGMVVTAPPELTGEAARLRSHLEAATGMIFDGPRAAKGTGAHVEGDIVLKLDETLGAENYHLSVRPSSVTISAGGGAGIQHGSATLWRSFAPDIFRVAPITSGPWTAPCMEIADRPAFQWRGILVDVARHFLPKRELFRLIDLFALLQFNVLHLHLTDDQGWRIPIEGYPRLIEVSSWREDSQVGADTAEQFEGTPHGGYYTQDDLRELVAYAGERHISIMPEIDLPGHMEAAIAAYPDLGTSRECVPVRTKWGISTNVLNLDPGTVHFVLEVVRQVADIFPFEYLSIGGDECPTEGWARDTQTQERKSALGIRTDRGIQAWYINQVATYLRSRGRRLVLWDEVLEDEVDEDAVILSWRGMRGAEIGLARGLDVVACPTSYCYLDYRQSDNRDEPVPLGTPLTLERAYSFNPIPAALEGKEGAGRVLGGQANLWSEQLVTPRSVDFAAFPRAAAIAEVLWSGPGGDFADFEERLPGLLARLDVLGVEYRPLGGPLPWQKRPGTEGWPHSLDNHEQWLASATANLVVSLQ